MIRRPLFLTRHFWCYGFSIRTLVEAILASFGALWLAVSVTAFFSKQAASTLSSWGPVFLAAGLAYAAWRSWPVLRVSHRLPGRDTRIELRVANIFDLDGAMVITANSTFETDTPRVIASDSLQGQFTSRYYSTSDHLAHDLVRGLKDIPSQMVLRDGREIPRYPLGTVVQLSPQGRIAYFLALTELNEHGNALGSFETLQRSLPLLWEFIATRGDPGTVLIPALGTGRARLPETREQVIREIVRSFVAACAAKRFCEALVIVISPRDYAVHEVDLQELGEFVRHTCRYTEFVETTVGHLGTGIT